MRAGGDGADDDRVRGPAARAAHLGGGVILPAERQRRFRAAIERIGLKLEERGGVWSVVDAPATPPPKCRTTVPPGKKFLIEMHGEEDLASLASWYQAVTCRQLFTTLRATGRRFTLYLPRTLVTVDEAERLVRDALQAAGFTVEARRGLFIDAPPTVASAPPPSPPPVDIVGDRVRCEGGVCRVSRALLDELLANTTVLSTSARFVPSVKDGRPNGFKIYAIRPASVFARLGLKNGDTVEEVDGLALDGPDHAIAFYAGLRTARSLDVRLLRGGAPQTLRIVFVDP